ncbi:MAG: TolB family protein, partial [bacterium]
MAWPSSSSIYAAYAPSNGLGPARIEEVELSTGVTTPLQLTLDPVCIREDFVEPTRLPNGQLGFLDHCIHALSDPEVSTIKTYPGVSGVAKIVANLGTLPSSRGQFGFNPSMHQVVIGIGNQACNSISIYRDSIVTTPPIQIVDGGHSFGLDKVSDGRQDCTGDPIVDWPDWSPDGNTISFVASTDAIGVSGPARLDAMFSVWALDIKTSVAHRILTGLNHPRSLRWSPMGNSLAFSGELAGQQGTWVMGSSGGSPQLVSSLEFAWLAWSPDGSQIVGSHVLGPTLSELITLPVHCVTGPTLRKISSDPPIAEVDSVSGTWQQRFLGPRPGRQRDLRG